MHRIRERLTVSNVLDGALLVNVDVEAIGLVVHGAHRVGLENAVLRGEVLLSERLLEVEVNTLQWGRDAGGCERKSVDVNY